MTQCSLAIPFLLLVDEKVLRFGKKGELLMKILTSEVEVGEWYRKELDGAVSSIGKPYNMTFKKGTVNKLLVFFFGGGLSWDEETASKPITIGAMIRQKETFYIRNVPPIQLKSVHVGLLNTKDKRNPFADWDMLVLPYSSADFHLGNNEFAYQDGKKGKQVLHHRGATNVEKALELLKEIVPDTPEDLVIAGVSAGGFGCVAHAPAIHKLYPDCKNIVVYSEGAYLHASQWPDITKNIWKVSDDLAPYLKSADLVADLFHYAKAHMPDQTVFLHSNSVWDVALVKIMNKMNHGKLAIDAQGLQRFHDELIQSVKTLKHEIPNYYYYLTDYGKKKDGTTPHIFLGTPKLIYGAMQDGVSIINWLMSAIEKEALDVGTKFIENDCSLFKN